MESRSRSVEALAHPISCIQPPLSCPQTFATAAHAAHFASSVSLDKQCERRTRLRTHCPIVDHVLLTFPRAHLIASQRIAYHNVVTITRSQVVSCVTSAFHLSADGNGRPCELHD